MYKRFHQLVCRQVEEGRGPGDPKSGLPAEMAAWGLLGLATISNAIREPNLLPARQRERMFATVANCLVSGEIS
jgi:hypothetical protein